MTREQLEAYLEAEEGLQSCLDALTNRELEIFSMMSQGQGSRQICDELNISAEQLERFKASIHTKCGFRDDAQLLRFAAQQRNAALSASF